MYKLMTKKKKKHKATTSPVKASPSGEVRATLNRFNWKKALLIMVCTIVAFTVYEALISVTFLRINGIPVIMPIYYIIVTILLVAIVFFNHGFSTKPVTPDMLSGLGTEEELNAACIKLNFQKQIAKRLMLVLVPFLLAVLFDIIYLYYGDILTSVITSFFGGNK